MSEDKSKETILPNVKTSGLFFLMLSVILVWALSWVLSIFLIPSWDDRGNFGAMFGAINAFFSGAALAGVIYAILLQRRDLELQRLELKLTREELHRAALAQENSEKALSDQAESLKQAAKLSAMSTLLGAYTRSIEWFEEEEAERRRRLAQHGGVVIPDTEFKKLVEQTVSKYRNIILELEALVRERRD